MASNADLELEKDLMRIGSKLVSPPSDIDELLSLLDETDALLSKVDQSPSNSMFSALGPAMKALVAHDLLRHPDIDVKVSVASCVSEITRITAPDAPYDDNLMKVIFQMIVDSFRELDDVSSRSFSKRVSILETVAKVRSCVVMLDLECETLILEMFNHFLKTIRSNHPEEIFSSMVMIMSLVIEESEDISSELMSCLLDSVKDKKAVLPIAYSLGEKVILNCAPKLKAHLTPESSSEYSKIIASICQDNSAAVEPTEINVSGYVLAEDSKLSEKTVSDEMPEDSARQEMEVVSPEIAASSDRSPTSVVILVNNGVVATSVGDSVVQPSSPKQKPERSRRGGQPKVTVSVERTNSDNLETAAKLDSTPDAEVEQKQECDSVDLTENNCDKEAIPAPNQRESSSNKEGDSLEVDVLSSKEVEPEVPLEASEMNDQSSHSCDNGIAHVSSPKSIGNTLDTTRPKRGRPPGSKSSKKRGAGTDQLASSSVEKEEVRNTRTKGELLPSEDNNSKKEHEAANKEEGKPHGHTSKREQLEKVDDDGTPVEKTDSEAIPTGKTGKKGRKKKVAEGEPPEKRQKSNIKYPKGKTPGEKSATEGLILKNESATPISVKNERSKEKNRVEDRVKKQSGRKRASTEEISEMLDQKSEPGQNLVGTDIQVWWPDDKSFYKGVVDSFDPKTGKHKIVYDDGDIEILLLKEERYKLGEGGSETEMGEGKDVQSFLTPEVPRHKRSKLTQDSFPKQIKSEGPSKGADSDRKPRGRPKGGASVERKKLLSDSTKASQKSKGKAPRANDELSKSSGRQKGGLGKKSDVDNFSRDFDDTFETGPKETSLHGDDTKMSSDSTKASQKSKGKAPSAKDELAKCSSRQKGGSGKKSDADNLCRDFDDTFEAAPKENSLKGDGNKKNVSKPGRKPRDGTPKTNNLKGDTPASVKPTNDSAEDSKKSSGRPAKQPKNDGADSSNIDNNKTKYNSKAALKSQPKDSVSTDSDDESSADETLARKVDIPETVTLSKAREGDATTGAGNKRKKGRK